MDGSSPGLVAARRLSRRTGAEIQPADAARETDGVILLVDAAPTEVELAALAERLPLACGLVLWVPGWSTDDMVAVLGRHGFAHGSVSPVSVPRSGALAVLFATEAQAEAQADLLVGAERPFRTLAIMPAYNEADVIFHAVGALVSGGVDVYLVDHASTDGTADAARPWLGRGLVHIERFPEDAGFAERNLTEMVWRDILTRVQQIAGEVSSDWYLFVNADEFRESPWPGTTLAEGLREVDRLGFNAVNFELFNFRPTPEDRFVPGEDVRSALRHYEPPGRYDILQIKGWKRQAAGVDIVQHGGHDVLFEGKRVYPLPFLLRHYPIRSAEHGARKIHQERLARFAAEERADGWHVQYDHYADGASFLAARETLSEWDGGRIRAEILSRALRHVLLLTALHGVDLAALEVDDDRLEGWVRHAGTDATHDDITAARRRLDALIAGNDTPSPPGLDELALDLSHVAEAQAILRGEPLVAAQVGDARDALRRIA